MRRPDGSVSYRVPWDYGEEAVEVTREFTDDGTVEYLRRRGDRLHVTTDNPHPWQLRIGGPNATAHTRPAGTSEADPPYPA